MTRLAAIISFILALCFYCWTLKEGTLTWEFWMLLGFVLESVSGDSRAP